MHLKGNALSRKDGSTLLGKNDKAADSDKLDGQALPRSELPAIAAHLRPGLLRRGGFSEY